MVLIFFSFNIEKELKYGKYFLKMCGNPVLQHSEEVSGKRIAYIASHVQTKAGVTSLFKTASYFLCTD